jgi:F-type H+-transporting ATPase subunit epsilon
MTLEIITPDKKLFSGEVKVIQLPGSEGSFELLNNHAPIVSTLSIGKIRIVTEQNKEQSFEIGGGVVEMNNNKVIILAESV